MKQQPPQMATRSLGLGSFIASSMVLQRDISAQIWGVGGSGSIVTVNLDGQPVGNATVNMNGTWVMLLPPQPASAGRELRVSDNKLTIDIADVAFGDVFLCTGQSNMEFSLNDAFNASEEIADSARYPGLRLATVEEVQTSTPQTTVGSKANNATIGPVYNWRRSGADAFVAPGTGLPARDFSYFSAVCYLFGRDLYTALDGSVPIGLLAADVGGVKVETLMSADALVDDSCGGTAASGPQPAQVAPPAGLSGVWNGMIHPLLPMRLRGVVMYQGESNSLSSTPTAYVCLGRALHPGALCESHARVCGRHRCVCCL